MPTHAASEHISIVRSASRRLHVRDVISSQIANGAERVGSLCVNYSVRPKSLKHRASRLLDCLYLSETFYESALFFRKVLRPVRNLVSKLAGTLNKLVVKIRHDVPQK